MAEFPKYFYFRIKSDGLNIQIEDDSDADVVEVVRCKDCAYMEHGVKDSNEVWCCWHDSRMMEDDFCSRGREK